jgi:predicted CXXCH cytochrome family protein
VLILLVPLLLLLARGTHAGAGNKADVLLSKHNLSVTGPGPVTSQAQDACIFCHTPHTSYVDVKPLWNHELPIQTYNTYTSSTYDAGAATPSAGVSKLCLSCHDGTVALGQTVSEGLVPTTGSMSPQAVLGTNLTNDHPLGITPVDDGQLVLSLFQNPPTSGDPTVGLPGGRVECTSCHDAHTQNTDAAAQSFLVRSNSGGAICVACHDATRAQPNALNGWLTGAHATATNSVPTTSSFGPYGTVNANACGNCHLLHNAGAASAARLLRASEESACSSCHSGTNVTPALRNVLSEFTKTYAHPTTTVSGQHDAAENAFPLNSSRHAECADCHNSHAASGTGGATSPPGVEAPLLGVSGYNGAGALRPASNEYEVCFKCHADSTGKPQSSTYTVYGYTPYRVTFASSADPYDVRLQMQSTASSHPVTHPRSSPYTQPSLRSNMLTFSYSSGRAMGTQIYCTDCHTNDQNRKFGRTGPNGPHGSVYTHILERNYQVNPRPSSPGGTIPQITYVGGINGPYALCEKCHNFSNLFAETTFLHNYHTGKDYGFSCAICHSPHGVANPSSNIGPRLVNFDTRFVAQNGTNPIQFNRTGRYCMLVCHGRTHNSSLTY